MIRSNLAPLTSNQYCELGRELVRLFAEQSLDFGSKVFKKQNQCKKGFACGYSCVSKTKTCKSPLSGQAKDYAGWLKIQIAAGSKLSKEQEADAKGLGLVKAKRTVAAAQGWYKTSLSSAPDDIKKLMDRVDDPFENNDPIQPGKAPAYYRPKDQSINMGKFANDGLGQAIYRHELGHHVDAQLGRFRRAEMIKRGLKAAGLNDLDELEALNTTDLAKYNTVVSSVSKSLGIAIRGVGGLRQAADGTSPGYVSSSKAVVSAQSEDEKRILQLADKTKKAYVSLAKTDLAKYATDPKVAARLGGKTLDQLTQAEQEKVGVQIMVAKVKENLKGRIQKLGLDPKDEASYVEAAKREFENDQTIYGALYRDSARRGYLAAEPVKEATWLFLLRGTRDVEMLAQHIDATRGGSNVQDLVGSLTKNKVSQGHADSYYAGVTGGIQQRTEVFANTFDLHSSGNELDKATVEFFSPNGYKAFKGLINAANNGQI